MDNEAVERIKERLQRYAAMQRDNDIQIERLERMQETLGDPSVPSLSGMSRSTAGGVDRIGRLIGRKDELEREIRQAITREQEERTGLEKLLLQLRDPDEEAVIQLRYFDQEDWDVIADALFSEGRCRKSALNRAYRTHRFALEHLAEMEE